MHTFSLKVSSGKKRLGDREVELRMWWELWVSLKTRRARGVWLGSHLCLNSSGLRWKQSAPQTTHVWGLGAAHTNFPCVPIHLDTKDGP